MALKSLDVTIQGCDPLLIQIILKKIDQTAHLLFEQSLESFEQFLVFLENRFQILANREPNKTELLL